MQGYSSCSCIILVIFIFSSSSEVYIQDIISAVSFSLRREVAKKNIIDNDAMFALKDWVNLLAKVKLSFYPFL